MGIDNVAASHFYKDDGGKTKQNWYLYEFANVLFSKIDESPKLVSYRKKHSKDNIVAFCIYFSKRSLQTISAVREGREFGSVMAEASYVYEFYPGNSRTQTQRLLEVALEAWAEHLQVCTVCPIQCLENGFEPTDMFDNLERTGWPTI